MQLINQMNEKCENNSFTLGIFLDLSTVFDNANHQIFISKLWFKSYLINHSQYLNYNNNVTDLAQIKCGLLQGSILEPLLMLNKWHVSIIASIIASINVSIILDPTMFADDTQLYLSHQNVNTFFKNI